MPMAYGRWTAYGLLRMDGLWPIANMADGQWPMIDGLLAYVVMATHTWHLYAHLWPMLPADGQRLP